MEPAETEDSVSTSLSGSQLGAGDAGRTKGGVNGWKEKNNKCRLYEDPSSPFGLDYKSHIPAERRCSPSVSAAQLISFYKFI